MVSDVIKYIHCFHFYSLEFAWVDLHGVGFHHRSLSFSNFNLLKLNHFVIIDLESMTCLIYSEVYAILLQQYRKPQ